MGSRKRLLAVGDRCFHYDLTFRHTEVVHASNGATALRAMATFEPDAILIAADQDGHWINVLAGELRQYARGARIVAVVNAPEWRRASIAQDGADYCVCSWLAVVAQDLLGLSTETESATAPRRRRARLH